MASYILQIHIGSFLNKHTSIDEIKEKIDTIIHHYSIQSVIFGWNLDHSLNQSILDYFHQNKIPCFFWLPVLSEVDQIKESTFITNYTGQQGNNVQIIKDESFSFLCPTNARNYQNICDIYEEYLADLSFDGVFLDKIRYPSFANGYEEGFGCFCESCQKIYEDHGIDVVSLKEYFHKHDSILLKGHYDDYGHYIFDDQKINCFYQIRSQIITEMIASLCDYFHHHHLKVGLDIYAPFFAYHCGQDIYELSKKADFLKPMFYRYTNAPAGMKYEYDAYKQYFLNSKDFHYDPLSKKSLKKQVDFLRKARCDVYPGIEVHTIENICTTNQGRFIDSQQFFQQYFETVVCCWNCLLMNDDIKESLL